MKILIVSDTHRNSSALKEIIEGNSDADMLIHLGDGENEFADMQRLFPEMPMVYVAGNCDYGQHEAEHIVIAGGIKIFCCHGHRYAIHTTLELLAGKARSEGCAVALYGHSHVFKSEFVNGVLVMNPGSPSEPRGGNKPTYGILCFDGDGVLKPEIVEFERAEARK